MKVKENVRSSSMMNFDEMVAGAPPSCSPDEADPRW
jgi:hypothetical protein